MRNAIRVGAINLAVIAAVLIAVEGLLGFIGAIRQGMPEAVTERAHTVYDPDLGWINERNVRIDDLFAPHVGLRTNGQRFRNASDFSSAIPEGRVRLICSGDSFTLGFGVGDADTWCEGLTRLDPRVETINMGQAGYGLDQAYLWYRRDGVSFDHQIHVLAFITDDFRRMELADFFGYPKPVLEVVDGALTVGNVPVPREPRGLRWQLREGARSLHTYALTRAFAERIGVRPPPQIPPPPLGEEPGSVGELIVRVLDELQALNRPVSRKLVLLYLPTMDELVDGSAREWREFIAAAARTRNIALIDAFDAFERLPTGVLRSLYIADDPRYVPAAAGHLSVKGNAFVASMAYEAIGKDVPSSRQPGAAP